MDAQDFIAMDLLIDGEYDPQFDFEIITESSLDDDEWYFDFSKFHG